VSGRRDDAEKIEHGGRDAICLAGYYPSAKTQAYPADLKVAVAFAAEHDAPGEVRRDALVDAWGINWCTNRRMPNQLQRMPAAVEEQQSYSLISLALTERSERRHQR
jgi:hypothetical protein